MQVYPYTLGIKISAPDKKGQQLSKTYVATHH